MLLLNFSHPLPPDQLARLNDLIGQPIDEVRHLPAQFDQAAPLGPQAQALVARVDLSGEAWQTAAILVILPALNYIAAAVLAELHGRMGYFPPVVRLAPVANALPPRFEVAEVLNLQALRDAARLTRRAVAQRD